MSKASRAGLLLLGSTVVMAGLLLDALWRGFERYSSPGSGAALGDTSLWLSVPVAAYMAAVAATGAWRLGWERKTGVGNDTKKLPGGRESR
jgi:hypothetical protein